MCALSGVCGDGSKKHHAQHGVFILTSAPTQLANAHISVILVCGGSP